MRDLSRSKRIILITAASVLVIVSGILFIIGGSVINSVPKDEPESAQSSGTVSQIEQPSFTEAPALEPAPAPATPPAPDEVKPDVAAASDENNPPAPEKEKKGGIGAFLSGLVRRN